MLFWPFIFKFASDIKSIAQRSCLSTCMPKTEPVLLKKSVYFHVF